MIRLIADNQPVKVEWIEFSDGALTCKIIDPPEVIDNFLTITVDPSTPVKQVMEEIKLVFNACANIWKHLVFDFNLNLPYLPYARAERVFEVGNPNPLKVFLEELDTFGFDFIFLTDPHPSKDVIDSFYSGMVAVVEQHQLVINANISPNPLAEVDYLVAPDKGAVAKAMKLSQAVNIPLLTATKVRDISTGRIIETTFDTEEDLTNKVILIVDDLLDGGNTFIPLANSLKDKGAKKVNLWVTHLIATKGLGIFHGIIDQIYCYQIAGNYINDSVLREFNILANIRYRHLSDGV